MERDLALAELALTWNLLSQKDLLACMKEQGRSGPERSLGQILVDKGHLSAAELQSLIRELRRTLIYRMDAEDGRSVVCSGCGSVYLQPGPISRDMKCGTCKAPLLPPKGARAPRQESVSRLELVRAVHDKFKSKGMTLARARAVVDAVLEAVATALAAGKRVDLRTLGVFQAAGRAPRKARNPRTGESISVPYRASVRFKASGELLKRLRTRRAPAKA